MMNEHNQKLHDAKVAGEEMPLNEHNQKLHDEKVERENNK